MQKRYSFIKHNERLWKFFIDRDFDLICENCEKGSLILLYRQLEKSYCVDTKTFDLEKKGTKI